MPLNRLHHKLSIYTLFFASFLAVITIVFSFFSEFYHSKNKTIVMLTQLMDTVESTAAIAAYTHDPIIANDVINGLLRNDIVYSASIISDQGLLAEKEKSIQVEKPVQLTRPLYSPFSSSQQEIGQLIITPNTHYNVAEARHAAYSNTFNSIFLIATTTLILLIVVRIKISQPLVEVSDSLHDVKAGEKKRINTLKQHKHDELGRLINDINELLKNLETKLTQEQILRKSVQHMEKQLRHIYESSSAGLFLLDTNGKLISFNQTLHTVLHCKNHSSQKVTRGEMMSLFVKEKEQFQLMLSNALQSEQLQAQDFLLHLNQAQSIWIHCVLSKVVDSSGNIRIEGVMFDVSMRVISEQAVKYEAEHDSLTGLLRRQAAKDKFDYYLQANDKPAISLFLLDLDKFKLVNDTYGHDAGDQVLITVAERIRACVRASDIVSRLGGDEFLIIIFNNQSPDTKFSIANKIIQSMQHPIVIGQDLLVNIGVSIGIATTPQNEENFDILVKSADEAMYEVKRQGKNGYGIKLESNQIDVTLF